MQNNYFISKFKIVDKEILYYEFLDKEKLVFLWKSSTILAHYIMFNFEKFKNKVFLELGSGTGALGTFILKEIPDSYYIFTDVVLDIIEKNLILNEINNKKYELLELDWTLINIEENSDFFKRKIHYIILSDILYEEGLYDDIFYILRGFSNNNPELIILVTYEERGLLDRIYLYSENWGFKLKNIDCESEFYKYLNDNNIFLDQILIFELI